MASSTLSMRDKKMMIWNFMEELCRRAQNAINEGRQPIFHLSDFDYINLFESYLSKEGLISSNTDGVILDTLLEYENRGYYKIENDIVTMTESGMAACRNPVHDWD
jgi:hypothetical protein